MDKLLIAYYSKTGSTQKVANQIQEETGADIFQIEPENPYPDSYSETVEQARGEIDANYKPALKSEIDDIGSYDTILVGTPNWWSTIAPPVVTFLYENDLRNKTIIPFCTHGGGGEGRIKEDIVRFCPQSTVLDCLPVHGGDAGIEQPKLSAWLNQIR